MKKIRKAVIPAAGFGTRFLPATKAMPKEMLPIVDKPTIQYIVEEILESGINEILIISGHAKRAIEDHFDSSPELERHLYEHGKVELLKEIERISSITVHYVRQKHMNGLGDAILCAKTFMDDEPFGVILGDDIVYNPKRPALKQLIDMYNETGSTILGCQEVEKEAVSSYGIIKGVPTETSNLYRVEDMVEKPAWKRRRAAPPCWDDMSLPRTSSRFWNRRSREKAEKFSSPMHSGLWLKTAAFMRITLKAAAMM